MERLANIGYPPSVGKLRPAQIAQRSTWQAVPDTQAAAAAMHVIHIRPLGASTETIVNPMDPASLEVDGNNVGPGYLLRPGAHGTVHRTGWRR